MIRAGVSHLASVDEAMGDAPSTDVPSLLKDVSLEEWGELLLDIPPAYPNLRARFPSMPSDQVQDSWTGRHGGALLEQSVEFVRSLVVGYHALTDRPIGDSAVLDFGCGWGRLIRLLYKYVDADRIYGVDPWDESIRLCHQHGVLGNLAISDYVPRTLPFRGPFELIYAFSVFTHLSEKTTQIALETLRRYNAEDGVLAITIRPPSYWEYVGREDMIAKHVQRGFAFLPHDREPIDGDVTYGDTSMTIEYLADQFPFWEVVRVEVNPTDSFQTVVWLAPR